MGFLDLFKKKKIYTKKEESKILLAMPMFNNGERYRLNEVINHLKSFWTLTVTETDGDDESAVFKVDGEMVAIAYMPVHIPKGDIEGTAKYAYNWPDALQELSEHNGHAIVSVMAGNKPALERFRILSKVLCSMLFTSNAIGVYQGGQTLLIPKSQYLANVEDLQANIIPVAIWVYLGLTKSEKGNSIYTYGLTEFSKQEIEIIDSNLDHEELFDFIANIVSYIIASDVTLKDGETLGYSEDQKIKITLSDGVLVEGQSLKLDM